jgi:hypothetical protein
MGKVRKSRQTKPGSKCRLSLLCISRLRLGTSIDGSLDGSLDESLGRSLEEFTEKRC